MRLGEIVRLVWVNITENKFKVILTSLGIIVGAATIVMVIAIGRGGQMDVADQFKNLNAGAIDITYKMSGSSRGSGGMDGGFSGGGGFPGGGGGGTPAGGGFSGGGAPNFGGAMPDMGGMGSLFASMFGQNDENITLSEVEVEDIEIFVPDISAVTISASTKSGVTGGDLEDETQYTVAGVKDSYQQVSNLELAVGDFITEEDDENEQKVAILGAGIAEEIFGSAMEAYDSVIYIDERAYVVNGVLKQMGSVSSGISPDEAIFIPYSTAKKYLMGKDISPQITVIAEDVKNVPTVIENIETVLAQSYPNATFTITDAGSKMEAATASANTLSTLLIAVASIVFVVGGIGIMNVLFVSVKERTPEIGVLKALGCSKRDILSEFLLESNMISTFGGVVGIGLSFVLMPLMKFTGTRVEPTASGAVMALLFAVLTGTVFGFYPAFKAAALIPIEALSQE